MIEVPDVAERRTDRKTCAHCEASAAGCRSNSWLRGRNCCDACTGNHDDPSLGAFAPGVGAGESP